MERLPQNKIQLANAMAFLHCEMMGRNASKKFLAHPPNRIIHVFDTDVLVANWRPFVIGPAMKFSDEEVEKKSLRRGYGQLLPRLSDFGDVPRVSLARSQALEDVMAWHTAELLTDACFRVARHQEHPIYQFSGHLRATEGIVSLVRAKSAADVGGASTTGAEELFFRRTRAVARHLINQNLNAEAVEFVNGRLEEALLETFEGRSAYAREWLRIEEFNSGFGRPRLFDEDVLKKLYASNYHFDQDFVSTEQEAENLLRGFWRRAVLAEKSTEATTESIDDDVEALVQLTRINRRLMNDHEAMRCRVVFVTGDRSLVRATYGIVKSRILHEIRAHVFRSLQKGTVDEHGATRLASRLEHYFGVLADNNGVRTRKADRDYLPGWFENFSHHYVRHFWSIAGDALIDSGAEADQLRDFFHGFFARAGDRLRLSRKNLEHRVLMRQPLDPAAAREIDGQRVLLDWEKLTKRRLAERNLSSVSLDEFLKFSTAAQPAKLPMIFMELSERQRDRGMVQVSDYGAESVLKDRGVLPPDLHFRTMPRATLMFKRLATNYYSSPGRFQADFQMLAEDCHSMDTSKGDYDDRQLSHVKFLVLAVAFAVSEKWAAALGHVERARRIISRGLRGDNWVSFDGEIRTRGEARISGREAAYLAAICQRMRASEQPDFDRCVDLLDEVEQLTHLDWVQNGQKLDLIFHLARLANERWSLNLARYFYERSSGEVATKLVEGLVKSFSDVHIAAVVIEAVDDDYALTRDSIALNILQTYAVVLFRQGFEDGESESSKEARVEMLRASARQALVYLSERLESVEYVEPVTTKCYRLTIALHESSWGFTKFRDRGEIDELFSRARYEDRDSFSGHRNASRAEYDLWRIDALKKFALHSWERLEGAASMR